MNLDKTILLLLVNFFGKKTGLLFSTCPEFLAFGGNFSANFQPILDCFIPKFKLKYENSEKIKAGRVNTVVFNLHQIKRPGVFFWDTRYN